MSDLPRLSAALARQRGLLDRQLEDLPIRALQFGTGALLRGLVEDALDPWSGRVVVVSQTGSGRGAAFNEQDGLFTLRVRGVDDGEVVDRVRVVSSIAHALSATHEWEAVLDLARQPALELVISNTTEIGLTWDDADDAEAAPPASFPAKLAALLHARLEAEHGPLLVLPTELVDGNGDHLRDLVLRWGERSGWGPAFADFVGACTFANTLVDRIVTGTPPDLQAAERAVGWRDPLMTDTEVYRLWAIEGDEALRERLAFADGDPGEGAGIVVAPSVEPFRLRKVRLLNAAHTLLVPVALGCGLRTVRDAVEDARVGRYVRHLMYDELVPAVADDLEAAGFDGTTARPFAEAVLDRFANPFLEHELRSITLQQTMKMGVRAVPSLLAFDRAGVYPTALSLGMAAFLLLHRQADAIPPDGALSFATTDLLPDDRAETIRRLWRQRPDGVHPVTQAALSDVALWGTDLTDLPRTGATFALEVARLAARALDDGLPAVLDAHLALNA